MLTGPRHPDTLHSCSASSPCISTSCNSTVALLVHRTGYVNNITIGNLMRWQGYSYCGLPACEKMFRFFFPQSGHWSARDLRHGGGLVWADSLTPVIELQEEYCIRIKWKTILTQTAGAVARENKLIEELSAPCGLVVRPAAESMIRLNMH